MKYINEITEDNTIFGIYTITFTYNNKELLYIGSTTNFKMRFKHHCSKLNRNEHNSKYLQRVYNKHPDANCVFEAKWIFNNEKEMLAKEGLLIRLFKPELNTCLFPEFSGKPNYKRKLSKSWINNLHINNTYSHTDSGNLEKISKQNNEGGTKIKTTCRDTGEVLVFNTMKEFNKHYNKAFYITRLMKSTCKMHKTHIIELIKKQTKRVNLYKSGKLLKTFDTAGKCDLYLNTWRGATSNAICNQNGILHEYVVEYV